MHPFFLLRRAPNDKLIAVKLGALGASISPLRIESLAELTNALPFYDLETLEVALTVIDELDLPNSPALTKLRRRVHMLAPSSGGKQGSQPMPRAESSKTIPNTKQDSQTVHDANSSIEEASSTNWV